MPEMGCDLMYWAVLLVKMWVVRNKAVEREIPQ